MEHLHLNPDQYHTGRSCAGTRSVKKKLVKSAKCHITHPVPIPSHQQKSVVKWLVSKDVIASFFSKRGLLTGSKSISDSHGIPWSLPDISRLTTVEMAGKYDEIRCNARWWWNQPIWKLCLLNWNIFPGVKIEEVHLKPTARMAVLHVAWQLFTDSFWKNLPPQKKKYV